MSIIDVINSKDGDKFILTEPSCNPMSTEYFKWEGVNVANFMGAILVTNSAGVSNLKCKDFLPLCGIVMKSTWTKLEKDGECNG